MAFILVFMTAATRREAQEIVQTLLDKRLIACANICGPVESHFKWQNEMEEASEFLVLMKSNRNLFTKLSKTIKRMHTYDVPEILAVPIIGGFPPYLAWLKTSLAATGEH
jgi:periplasmic divalent cation tolerance protein